MKLRREVVKAKYKFKAEIKGKDLDILKGD